MHDPLHRILEDIQTEIHAHDCSLFTETNLRFSYAEVCWVKMLYTLRTILLPFKVSNYEGGPKISEFFFIKSCWNFCFLIHILIFSSQIRFEFEIYFNWVLSYKELSAEEHSFDAVEEFSAQITRITLLIIKSSSEICWIVSQDNRCKFSNTSIVPRYGWRREVSWWFSCFKRLKGVRIGLFFDRHVINFKIRKPFVHVCFPECMIFIRH